MPLYSAIEVGCVGVEADIWLFDEQLYVGHSFASLTPNRTLNSLYIDPLLYTLSKQNPKSNMSPGRDTSIHGVFDTTPEQSLIFLIDFKTTGATLWPYVQSALEPLRSRNYLARSNGTDVIPGPITIVGTGNTPFDLVSSDVSNPHRDIFFDAPLGDLWEASDNEHLFTPSGSVDNSSHDFQRKEISQAKSNSERKPKTGLSVGQRQPDEEGQGKSGIHGADPNVFNPGNSYYASVAFGKAIGELQDGEFSEHQLNLLRGQIRGAHKRGLKARYWDLPFWPINLRNHVWDVLVKEGVDMLNVDDLKGATRRDWDKYRGWGSRKKDTRLDVQGGNENPVED